MATVSMTNLNSPATEPGPLTSDDLDWWRRADMLGVDIDRIHKRPYIPAGCDQQGRIEPAEACTDVGTDEPLTSVDVRWVYCCIAVPLALVAIGALIGWLQ